MYTKRVQIPQPGKRESLPSVEGEAIDVLRLDWLGAEDPLGNPRVRADAGRIDQPLSERHPIRQDFRGLEIVNEDNQKAAGTVALLRIYEDARNVLQTQPRRQPTIQGAQQIERKQLIEGLTSTVQGGADDPSRTVSADLLGNDRDVAYRVWVSMYIKDRPLYPDNDLESGFRNVVFTLSVANQPLGVWSGSLGVGGNEQHTLASGAIVPKDQSLSANIAVSEDGEGSFSAGVKGLAIYDPKTEVPPR